MPYATFTEDGDQKLLIGASQALPEEVTLHNAADRYHDGGGRVDGYLGFYTSFEFDAAGAFIKVGAWE